MVDHLVLLEPSQCIELLAQAPPGQVGRVATVTPDGPLVVPVNFAVDGADIVFLAGEGTKLDAARCRQVLAFEVDDVDACYHTGWSVLIQGMAEEVTDPGALDRLGRLGLLPWAGGARHCFVRIHAERISGRRITYDRPPGARTSRNG
ncbi:MAG: pyridoxamine 5'-phosphate oxidase family protein [Acidimicrobiales bacterium]